MDLPNSTNAFIVNPKASNMNMQEAYYLPVSPDDSQVIIEKLITIISQYFQIFQIKILKNRPSYKKFRNRYTKCFHSVLNFILYSAG